MGKKKRAPQWSDRFFQPVDNASLVLFRVVFGAILLWEVIRYFAYGWIESFWVEPIFRFSYWGFGWVEPMGATGMNALFVLLGLMSICIATGFLYRFAAAVFFVGFTYSFLLEAARYLNHFYLVCLICFLMILVPVHRDRSLDVKLGWAKRSRVAPRWALELLRFQMGVVYFYGGVAKITPDWLRGEPLRTWLGWRGDWRVVGPLLDNEFTVYVFSYGGLLLDLFAVPLLLWRRTRVATFVVFIGFHLTNAFLFNIGIFPWFALAATTLFFEPDWPRRAWARLRKKPAPEPVREKLPLPKRGRRRILLAFLAVYAAVQLLLPLRHWLYPGNPAWTEQGHRFAWRMKLKTKQAELRFLAGSTTGGSGLPVDPAKVLTNWQLDTMSDQPELILEFAHHLAADFRSMGVQDPLVRVNVQATLNGRPHQALVDPNVNLAKEKRGLGAYDWIVPLEHELPWPPD